LDEVRSRVSQSLDAVGMLSYSQVGRWHAHFGLLIYCLHKVHKHPSSKTEANPNSEWWTETESRHCRCFGWSIQSTTTGWADHILGRIWSGNKIIDAYFV
jgi:hypothetical protein